MFFYISAWNLMEGISMRTFFERDYNMDFWYYKEKCNFIVYL